MGQRDARPLQSGIVHTDAKRGRSPAGRLPQNGREDEIAGRGTIGGTSPTTIERSRTTIRQCTNWELSTRLERMSRNEMERAP